MKQKQYAPMSVAEMALSIYAVNSGYMDKVDLKKVVAFEAALQSFAHTNYASMVDAINAQPKLTKENEAAMKKCIEDFVPPAHTEPRAPTTVTQAIMPGAKEIRSKIASVKSTKKNTK